MMHRVIADFMTRGQNFPDEIGIASGAPSNAKKCRMNPLFCKLV